MNAHEQEERDYLYVCNSVSITFGKLRNEVDVESTNDR